ncbi:hypothetical protein AWB92_14615 [Mycobacterium sp. IEC1808]|nr:hypothetical protein AWB92_14615 [Mycobacterium sp. IEC1808]
MRCTRRHIRHTRRRPDRRVNRLRRQRDRLATDRRLDLGQLSSHAFEVFGQAAALPGDIGQCTAGTHDTREPVGRSAGGTLRLHCRLGAARSRPRTIGRGSRFTASRDE